MGRLLQAEGFTNIQGADASAEFVRIANETGNYTGCHERYFGNGVDKLAADMLNKYDVVLGSGVFLDGHIPAAGFEDCHAMLKTGGHFVTSIRKMYYVDGHEYGYKEKLDEMCSTGKFEMVKNFTFKRGVAGAYDPLFVEMDSFMVIMRRTA